MGQLSSTTATTAPAQVPKNQEDLDTDREDSDIGSDRVPLRFRRKENLTARELARFKDLCLVGGIGDDSKLRYDAWVALLEVGDVDPNTFLGKEGKPFGLFG